MVVHGLIIFHTSGFLSIIFLIFRRKRAKTATILPLLFIFFLLTAGLELTQNNDFLMIDCLLIVCCQRKTLHLSSDFLHIFFGFSLHQHHQQASAASASACCWLVQPAASSPHLSQQSKAKQTKNNPY
jgi:hypothetical protein